MSFREHSRTSPTYAPHNCEHGRVACWAVAGTALLALVACRPPPMPTPTPQGKVVVATRWVSLLQGEFLLVDGCLRVNGVPGETSYLLAWPPEYAGKVTVEGNAVRIIDGNEEVVWHAGDTVRLGGGETGTIAHLGEQPPSQVGCPGPYWVVGDVAGPAARATADAAHPPATPDPEATTAVLSVEEMRRYDAQVYAEHFGVSLDEALRRSDLRDAFDGLGAELAEKERDTFSGLWIEHTPEYRIVVRFTRDGEETMQRYIAGQPYAEIVEVRGADLTLVELEALRAQAARIADVLGISHHSATNVEENRAEVWLPDPDDVARLEAALREAGMRVPEHVVVLAPVVVEPVQ